MKNTDIYFMADGTPKSAAFDDYYFSNGLGVEESNYVFISPNKLVDRFRNLPELGHFTIAETGFGTGLNFLLAWQCFLEHAPKTARLSFISCEKYPLSRSDLQLAHQKGPHNESLSKLLQEQYPPLVKGFHLLEFDRVNLTLILDDASSAYQQVSATVDAWFLDGFTPSKNPDMWQPELFKQMSRLSQSDTTVSTFTSARVVRDALQGAGFSISKQPGFGLKREMVKGLFIGVCGPNPITGWPSSELPSPKPNQLKRIAIIGAGIAGATTAFELNKRGYQVTVFEQADHLASGGSGNEQGAVYAKLSASANHNTQFYIQALVTAQKSLARLPKSVPHQSCGLVQLVHDKRELKRLNDIADSDYIPDELAKVKNSRELSLLLGTDLDNPGLWFPEGGWVSPKDWVKYLLTEIPCKLNQRIVSIKQTSTGWTLFNANDEQFEFDQVVLCSAYNTINFTQTEHLPLNAIAGQVTQIAATPTSQALKAVICTDRYVMPTFDNRLTIGSTFRLKSTETQTFESENDDNIEGLRLRVPSLLTGQPKVLRARAGVRCTTPDYLPLVGAMSPAAQLADQFTLPLQRNRAHKERPAAHIKGLWVNVGHGSKGLCSSHLSAKLLAAMINGEPFPVSQTIADHLNPNRFVVRNAMRAKRKKAL
ncbi:bifunctional tRNA (5-methylaminomethyl-2-thiouridine)(34)-methyltransferase MnmD/FAD-dependent 5-carboxymethylaminomethyl-2-thiouridine(34) oxidoreductase MnmC [Reinekea marina]|uniref:tRNA 5-methylaminomethyl-2-thiouridine biosynthesis bifunctional protein MnmC n=1 Tax=Reinekea marina TaxID=1310421 RepID=A0ABV7WR77_9GAMM|nr:bifunctional tRNA (5-methylaminomethyl-2-thiouridine)(34)-methyltransferase MnmD/FAD-dependent 5-carboxymethylaminomethyl-2-thiouridine(34) oxidoreductase MnmC [Reinekea marina]MDN3650430.1 bifunctional tRNA (5-methylaminomethyl-2-thiouridine)(34)-methyltransferase MnmD/FAD-dependent 5-carboxymethylaminomethyl-2-thiouridine(34) oxidoreductase MnmC [Reinekea marina]